MLRINKIKKEKKAQVIVEYTFCMIIVFLMVFAAIKVFRWTGLDLAERRKAHDLKLRTGSTTQQIDTFIMQPTDMDAVWDGN